MKQIELSDGRKAVNLIPNYEGMLAVVSLSVLQRITSYLPQVSVEDIIKKMKLDLSKLLVTLGNDQSKSEEIFNKYLTLIDDEITFHKSVNIIWKVNPEDLWGVDPQMTRLELYDVKPVNQGMYKAKVHFIALETVVYVITKKPLHEGINIQVDVDEFIRSGNGTEHNPYIITKFDPIEPTYPTSNPVVTAQGVMGDDYSTSQPERMTSAHDMFDGEPNEPR